MNLEVQIEDKRNLLRADRLDMSFGEIISNYEEDNLIIQPSYQRSFRWNSYQKTRFIESILLGIPIPPIFVAEDKDNGKWELVDGLQRVSTILSFFGILKKDGKIDNRLNKFKLLEGEILTELKDKNIDSFPLKLQLTIKRFVCRVEILRWDTNPEIKYQLFSRLNTGGEALKEQEIRNCIYRGALNDLINELAENKDFKEVIGATERQEKEMYLSELVLRFIAFYCKHNDLILKNGGSIQGFLSDFMHSSIEKNQDDFYQAKQAFLNSVSYLNENKFSDLFRDNRARQFNANHYDTIMYILSKNLNRFQNSHQFQQIIQKLLNNKEYDNKSGSSTYATKRMQEKIKFAEEFLENEL
ncbi:DUF262 domain-containing protein, partial [Campylobacter jejuni]|nr:DUF262 domain-containing protein [Campylobacter jejuni]